MISLHEPVDSPGPSTDDCRWYSHLYTVWLRRVPSTEDLSALLPKLPFDHHEPEPQPSRVA